MANQQRAKAQQAEQDAKTERDKAERRFNDVRGLANAFMFEFHDAIEPLAGSTPARLLVVKKIGEYLDRLALEASDNPRLQRDLSISYSRLGWMLEKMNNVPEAWPHYRQALKIFDTLARLDATSSQARKDLQWLLQHLQFLVKEYAVSAEDLNAYAWILLTCEPAELRDVQAALQYAQCAVAMTEGRIPFILDTLAMAYHLTGDHPKAIATAEQALALLPARYPITGVRGN